MIDGTKIRRFATTALLNAWTPLRDGAQAQALDTDAFWTYFIGTGWVEDTNADAVAEVEASLPTSAQLVPAGGSIGKPLLADGAGASAWGATTRLIPAGGALLQAPTMNATADGVQMTDAVVVIARATPGVTFSGVAEVPLLTATVPANALTNRSLRFDVMCRLLLNNATASNRRYRIRAYFGATLLYDDSLTTAPTQSSVLRIMRLAGMIGAQVTPSEFGWMSHDLGNINVPTAGLGRLSGTGTDSEDVVGTVSASESLTIDQTFQVTLTMPVNSIGDTYALTGPGTVELV